MIDRKRIIGTVGYLGGIMSLPEPFTWSWGNMAAFTNEALCQPDERINFERAGFSLHDYARNELLSKFRGDWLLQLDTDICFEPDLAARMVRTMYQCGVDVLTGIYCYKSPPHFPVLYMFNQETKRNEIIAAWDTSSEVFEVNSAGCGCLLVRRRVFERIVAELHESPFDRTGNKGEDHSFFARLRKLDIPAYCAWKIEVAHLAYKALSPSADYAPGNQQPANVYQSNGFRREYQ